MLFNIFNKIEELNILEDIELVEPLLEEPQLNSKGFMDNGKVVTFKDGIAIVKGLKNVAAGNIVEVVTKNNEEKTNEIDNDLNYKSYRGLVFNLNSDSISIGLLDTNADVREGSIVYSSEEPLTVTFNPEYFGHVINPLGNPITMLNTSSENLTLEDVERILLTPKFLQECIYDSIDYENELIYFPELEIESKAPGILLRQSVKETLVTGIKCVDSLIPIGRGQRELIIGDRKTGKTALAVDFMIQQAKFPYSADNVFSIYVAIGQKQSSTLETFERLRLTKSIYNTIIVSATAADSATLQFLSPYVGTAIGEYFRDRGQHALIVYDDLSKHAVAYREISLNLRRPPGREAFPGDVFYLHSRLLERSAKLASEVGGGSLTGIPIVETQAGDVSAYIPTNVISITDGQIVLNADLFNNGIRPAVDIGLSVSRVGSSAQSPLLKAIVSTLKLELAQYRDILGFTKLGTELDEATQKILDRGRIYETLLIQKPYKPLNTTVQALILTAALYGYLDDIKLADIPYYENEIIRYIDYIYSNRYILENNSDFLSCSLLELYFPETLEASEIITLHQSKEIFLDTLLNSFHKFLETFNIIFKNCVKFQFIENSTNN